MRIALLADVHANLHALEAVLAATHEAGCEQLWLAGDWVVHGAFPEETVTLLRAAGALAIAGDSDREVVAAAAGNLPASAAEPKRRALEWAAGALSAEAIAFLAALPEQRRLPLGAAGALLVHGSPARLDEHLWPDADEHRLRELAAGAGAPLVVCGHTHAAMDRAAGEARFLNPGSVGRPGDGDPRAGWALLEVDGDAPLRVSFRRVAYDHQAAAAAVRDRGLPPVIAEMFVRGRGLKFLLAQT